jgi:HAMP domain-containing protein
MAQRRKRTAKDEGLDELEPVTEKPSRKSRKKSKKAKETGKESSVIYRDGEMPRLHGKGVAFHLAMAISGVLVVILIFFGVVVYNIQSNSLDEQIDSGGIEAVRVLARSDYECWLNLHGTTVEGREAEAKAGNLKANLTEEEIARQKMNLRRLASLVEGETQILVANIWKPGDSAIVRSSFPDNLKYAFNPKSSKKVGRDVEVGYGTCYLNNKAHSARIYRCPIFDPMGKVKGKAEIVLSEEQIDESRMKLLVTMIVLMVVFIALGIGIAFFMGKKIATPVQSLIEDVSAVAQGDLEHRTIPRSQDEIGLLARTFDKMTKNLAEGRGREMELAAQRHQLAVANEVQEKLLPDVIPQIGGYEIQAYHRSSKDMGGNYYDVIQLPDGRVGALVASASGKGIPAAMVMTMARSFLRALSLKGDSLETMIRDCNRLLSPDLRAGMYVEILMVLIDPKAHSARLISAGPTMLLRYNAQTEKIAAVQADGIAMGFDKGPVFDKTLKSADFEFNTGDRLVLATQGLFTIKAPEGGDLGAKGLARFVAKHAAGDSSGFVRRLVNNLDNFAGGEVKHSNITFVTIKRTEA